MNCVNVRHTNSAKARAKKETRTQKCDDDISYSVCYHSPIRCEQWNLCMSLKRSMLNTKRKKKYCINQKLWHFIFLFFLFHLYDWDVHLHTLKCVLFSKEAHIRCYPFCDYFGKMVPFIAFPILLIYLPVSQNRLEEVLQIEFYATIIFHVNFHTKRMNKSKITNFNQ